jgi:trans-2,3-dihydro-3-hydroxyanthranilate isomerase
LPFAGHPTIGTAVALNLIDGGDERAFVLEEQVGPVPCRARSTGAARGHAIFDLPRVPVNVGGSPERADVARAPWRRGPRRRARRSADSNVVGRQSVHVRARARPSTPSRPARSTLSRFEQVLGGQGPGAAFVFCRETRHGGSSYHARMFAPAFGILEDPATGAAVAAFAGYLAASGHYADGSHVVRVEQGHEMGRPSLLELTMQLRGGTLARASIRGDAIVVSEGTIDA